MFGPALVLVHTDDLPHDALCYIAIYANDTTL